MRVTVVYMQPADLQQVHLDVDAGTTLQQAVEKSGIKFQAPLRLGVFGRVRELDTPVAEGDRIEIYRELLNDPKVARRQRAKNSGVVIPVKAETRF